MTDITNPARTCDAASDQSADSYAKFWQDYVSYARQSYRAASMHPQYLMLAGMEGMLNAFQPTPEPAGHRITLTRPRLLRSPLVIRTNANPDHARALIDLRHQFKAVTGREYLPRRGDTITHEVTA